MHRGDVTDTYMTIGIFVNESKDIGLTIARKLADAVALRGGHAVTVFGRDGTCDGGPGGGGPGGGGSGGGNSVAGGSLAGGMCGGGFNGCDVVMCVGGDGTLLKAARETRFIDTPLLGVNLGSLGYLTEVETSQIDSILDRIFIKDYRIEERMMLSISRGGGAPGGGDGAGGGGAPGGEEWREETVLNELYIGRGDSPHVVRLKIDINGSFLDVYSGDGVLISTPTGSTAYALSAGGPVIDPELSLLSIVPVCPHVIFSRPVLIAPDKEITITPVVPLGADARFSATVAVDGVTGRGLGADEVVKVRKSGHTTKILRFNADNFYVVLKDKLFATSGKYRYSGGGLEAPADDGI